MKAKKIFLFVTCIVLCILFVACSDEPTPRADNPQMANPAESKSFAQEKIEEAGFNVAKSDDVLPTMADLPDELQELAAHPGWIADRIGSVNLVSIHDMYNLADTLEANPEYIPQLAILAQAAYDSAEDLNWKNIESSPAVIALDEFGKSNGLWT